MPNKVEISHKTIIFTVLFLLFLWFLLAVTEIISWLFIAFILMSAFKPTVDFLENYKIPRVLAVLLIYLLIIIFFAFTGSTILPPLINQTFNLAEQLPDYLKVILPFVTFDPQIFSQQIAAIGQNLLKVSVSIFNNMIASFTILIITFYLLLERKNLNSYLTFLLGEKSSNNVISIIRKVEERLGAWVRGQVALLISIGIMTFIGLELLRIPYALPLAILAGILEIIPSLGPILASIPAIIVSFTVSSLHPLFTVILYFVIQQLENQVIVPFVMRTVVGLPPLITLLSILVGIRLTGIAGAILAVPVVVTIEAIFTEYYRLKEKQ